MARRSFWTQAKHQNGLEGPTSLPPEPWRSLQPSEEGEALFTMCFARVQ